MPSATSSTFLRRRLRGNRGFTLIELLVSAVITAVLAGFIVAIVSNVSSFWSRTTGKLSTEAQARLVLDQLSLDLSSAHYRDDGNVWMAANVLSATTTSGLWQPAAANPKPVNGVSLAMTARNLGDARFNTAGVWLRFFTTKRGNYTTPTATTPDPTLFSAPVAVGYQIIRRFSSTSTVAPAAQRTGYFLHRAVARPASTVISNVTRLGVMESGFNITSAAYTTNTANTNNGSQTGDPRTIQVVSTNARNMDSVIADNVIDFGVRCYVRDASQATGLRIVFPAANETGTASNAATARLLAQLPPNTVTDSTNYNFVMPEVVDVMVRILTDEGARLIALYEQANSPLTIPTGFNAQQYWWQIALANSQVFTRRIVINAQPL
jgi:prepilin-type N-terminal cleavage/methylation domain-containing protein